MQESPACDTNSLIMLYIVAKPDNLFAVEAAVLTTSLLKLIIWTQKCKQSWHKEMTTLT
jgi:hypothetical protein